ncbi:ATP-dependent helicase, partial [Intestinimonas massiliensis]|nr:ATP-dependent helicase [Intestinimonas massiliensis (ex Afouda et al. 2020)]
ESYFFSSPVVRDLTDILRFALDGRDAERFLRFYYKLDLRLKRRVLQDVLARYGGGAPVLDVLLDSGQIEPWQVGRLRALRTHFSKLPALGGFAALQR